MMPESIAVEELTISENLLRISENVPKVFDAGGRAYKQGFWNAYQNVGADLTIRGNYEEAFSGPGWTAEYFTPTVNLAVTASARNMFANSNIGVEYELGFDLVTRLQDLGKFITTQAATDISGIYYNTHFSATPALQIGNLATSAYHLFSESRKLTRAAIQITDSHILQNPATGVYELTGAGVLWTQCFEHCENLTDLTFSYVEVDENSDVSTDGAGVQVIRSSIDLQWSSALSKSSIQNVIENLDTSVVSQFCRLSVQAVASAYGNDWQSNAEWIDLVNSRPSWTITLIDPAEGV